MESRSSPHPHPRHPGSRRLSGTHWKSMQGAARSSFPRQRLRPLRHPAPLLNRSRVTPGMTWRGVGDGIERLAQHPPLPCQASPPQGGRSFVAMPAPFLYPWRLAKTFQPPISPLEGEMSGRTEGGAAPRLTEGHRPPLIRLPAPSPRSRGEGRCHPLLPTPESP